MKQQEYKMPPKNNQVSVELKEVKSEIEVDSSSSRNDESEKKILLLKYEGRDRVFYPLKIRKKLDQNSIIVDSSIQLKGAVALPVLLTNNKLRVYDPGNVFDLANSSFEQKFTKHEKSDYFETDIPEQVNFQNFFNETLETILKNVSTN
jgi:hypothetical protein